MSDVRESASARESIQASALRHFGTWGYAGTSLRQIAADAGCDVALIPYYFGSKSSLFTAVLQEARGETLRRVAGAYTAAGAARRGSEADGLVQFHRIALPIWMTGDGLLCVRALLITAASAGSVPEDIHAFARSELQLITDQAVDGDLPEETRFTIGTFAALVVGTAVLVDFAGHEALNALPREELGRLQLEALAARLSERRGNS